MLLSNPKLDICLLLTSPLCSNLLKDIVLLPSPDTLALLLHTHRDTLLTHHLLRTPPNRTLQHRLTLPDLVLPILRLLTQAAPLVLVATLAQVTRLLNTLPLLPPMGLPLSLLPPTPEAPDTAAIVLHQVHTMFHPPHTVHHRLRTEHPPQRTAHLRQTTTTRSATAAQPDTENIKQFIQFTITFYS